MKLKLRRHSLSHRQIELRINTTHTHRYLFNSGLYISQTCCLHRINLRHVVNKLGVNDHIKLFQQNFVLRLC